MKAPAEITTARLVLRRPVASDAEEIFARYAGDASVGRYLAWPIHKTIDDTRAFLDFSDQEWARWPAGPYLIFSKDTCTLLGSTGFSFETDGRAVCLLPPGSPTIKAGFGEMRVCRRTLAATQV